MVGVVWAPVPRRRGQTLKLVMVDSSKVFRMGLRLLLETAPEIRVVAECDDAAAAREAVAAHAPDLVITDLHLLDRNGLLLTRELRRLSPALRVLVLAVQ